MSPMKQAVLDFPVTVSLILTFDGFLADKSINDSVAPTQMLPWYDMLEVIKCMIPWFFCCDGTKCQFKRIARQGFSCFSVI